jgi:hypothetical protein
MLVTSRQLVLQDDGLVYRRVRGFAMPMFIQAKWSEIIRVCWIKREGGNLYVVTRKGNFTFGNALGIPNRNVEILEQILLKVSHLGRPTKVSPVEVKLS